ncbi:hypothetical protein M8C21_009652 [Ambrosia artemisiifolia]|uniref:Uncharacterized protein n=1 Tax=Ambrosia artemisiifolia TaxID=4212 RepID=A0AAD5GVA5_AMBAR|nr:hypothetical protein M8C21_009652 [Ambrosia artemisiifolia]
MPDSDSSPPKTTTNNHRLCDNCNNSTAILYCRADTAKLCLSCDRHIHSTNPLFTKHTRSLLCDTCHSSPASIFCSTHALVHCQNCDWETHNNNNNPSLVHDRRPLEGFNGCPSVSDLLVVFGCQDLGKKGVFIGGDGSGKLAPTTVPRQPHVRPRGDWRGVLFTMSHAGIAALIARVVCRMPIIQDRYSPYYTGLPCYTNRNAALGAYKDELLQQLRDLAKSDPNVDGGQEMIKPINEFPPALDFLLQGSGFEHKFEENANSSYETNTFQWCPDGSDAGDLEFYPDQLVGQNGDGSCIVPDEKFINIHNLSHVNANYEDQSHHTVAENTHVFHGVGLREINTQERETALTRYKEKKKSRRYDKHIRYESRKVRAESRTRIRGRFAKMDR